MELTPAADPGIPVPERRARPRIASQVAALEGAVINHPNHAAAMAAIETAHARWTPPTTPNRLKARFLLIVGESGAGKSTALEAYQARFPAIKLEHVVDGAIGDRKLDPAIIERLRDGDIVPVVLVEAPKGQGRSSERAFVAAMFQALGYKAAEHWNKQQIIKMLRTYADELGVELFLIDEGHHIVGSSNGDGDRETIEFLKSLLNSLGIPIVIAGLPHLLRLQHNEDDRQMSRRSQGAVRLIPYDWWTAEGRTRVMGYINKLEANLGLPEPSRLYSQEKAARLYVAASGEPGWIAKYMSEGLSLAIQRGRPTLDLDTLGEVHEGLFGKKAPEEAKMGFDEILTEEKLAAAAARSAAARALALEENPFLCSVDQLRRLWDRRIEMVALRRSLDAADRGGETKEATGTGGGPLRKTRLRGKGKPPVLVFGAKA